MRFGAMTVILATLATAGCGGGQAPVPRPHQPPRTVVILDADAYGAIVVDGAARVAIGFTRDGAVAWRRPVGTNAPPPVACLGRCPNPAAEAATNADTSWVTSADGRWALAITVRGPGQAEGRWHEREVTGWRPVGAGIALAGNTACLAPDGAQALLLGQRPAHLDHGGRQSPVTDLEQAGTCALAAKGGIVAELMWGPQGGRSALRVFDGEGKTTFGIDLDDAVTVTADPSRERVAYLASGTLYEISSATGAQLRVTSGVAAARYGRADELVVVQTNRSVAWLA